MLETLFESQIYSQCLNLTTRRVLIARSDDNTDPANLCLNPLVISMLIRKVFLS